MFDVVAYFDGIFCLSPNGEESLSPDPDPDLDRLRGGPGHGLNTSCVKKSSQSEQYLFELRIRTDKQTQMHYPRTPLR